MFNKKRKFKKLFGVEYFYTDNNNRFNYYYRKNWLDQFDVMVEDVESGFNRWFMVTADVFYTFIALTDHNQFLTNVKPNVNTNHIPRVVDEFVGEFKYKLVSCNTTPASGDVVVGKVGEFGPEDARESVLLLKRIATIPAAGNMILGMDTLEMPVEGVVKFTDVVRKKYFKDVDIFVDLEEE